MEVYFEAELPDKPGALIKLLEPMEKFSANVTEIVHIRERRNRGKIPVGVYLFIKDEEEFGSLLNKIEKMGFPILTRKNLKAAYEYTFILIGHVFKTGITDLIDKIALIPQTVVADVHAKIRSVKEVSTVSFTIGTEKKKNLEIISKDLEKLAKERDLKLINPLVIK